jgi:hypothetical protein
VVPNIANSMKKNIAITKAFIIEGTAFIRDMTAIFKPSFLEISLRGLNTLSIRMTLINSMFMELNMMDMSENITMMKSMMFHDTLR